jgi:dynein heavy chain
VDVNEGEKKGNIERWLSELEVIMRLTMKSLCRSTMKDMATPRVEWILNWPA